MAIFNGTIDEYHKYIGPRIRNRINIVAKSEREKRNGICEMCKENAELQSAHVHGKERKKIIEEIIIKYTKDETTLVDLGQIEEEIIKAHYPINDTFKFLCQKCHKKYDERNEKLVIKNKVTTTFKINIQSNYKKFILINDIKIPIQKKDNQILQDLVKDIFMILFNRKLIPGNEVKRLKDKVYSRKTFLIGSPLLIDKDANPKDRKGHNRYWLKPVFDDKYLICSQWWKDNEVDSTYKIVEWLTYIKKMNESNLNTT